MVDFLILIFTHFANLEIHKQKNLLLKNRTVTKMFSYNFGNNFQLSSSLVQMKLIDILWFTDIVWIVTNEKHCKILKISLVNEVSETAFIYKKHLTNNQLFLA